MKLSVVIFLGLLTTILVFGPAASAVQTSAIEAVRNKPVLTSQDKKVIDDFIREAVLELLEARSEDFTDIAELRSEISRRKDSRQETAEVQYAVHKE